MKTLAAVLIGTALALVPVTLWAVSKPTPLEPVIYVNVGTTCPAQLWEI